MNGFIFFPSSISIFHESVISYSPRSDTGVFLIASNISKSDKYMPAFIKFDGGSFGFSIMSVINPLEREKTPNLCGSFTRKQAIVYGLVIANFSKSLFKINSSPFLTIKLLDKYFSAARSASAVPNWCFCIANCICV